MPTNIQPIFPITQNIGKSTLTTADTSLTTPTTAGTVVFTAGANGSKLDLMKVRALGTNVQTVLRIFVNDGVGVLASSFSLVHEVKLPASTASATDASQSSDISLFPCNFDGNGNGVLPPYLPAGYKIYVSLGTTVASGIAITAFGGNY